MKGRSCLPNDPKIIVCICFGAFWIIFSWKYFSDTHENMLSTFKSLCVAFHVSFTYINFCLIYSNIHAEYFKKSEESWCYAQFIMQQEYKRKTAVPIPFSIFYNVYQLVCKCFKSDQGKNIFLSFMSFISFYVL